MTLKKNDKILNSSFRDPDGCVFERDGEILRKANLSYKPDYRHLMDSGLYEELVRRNMLLPHEELKAPEEQDRSAYAVIRPERLCFISYPYEWCFSQLQQAALTTLEAQKTAMRFGMYLKDASAYNIQFRDTQPVLIDTFSFRRAKPTQLWPAYGQFCRHFLAPLALMAKKDIQIQRDSVDEIFQESV